MAKGRNVVNLSDDDYKGATFKVAPAGKYEVTVTPKTKVGKSKSGGAKIEIHAKIAKGEHKGISFFDHVAASVTWKVAQVLLALGVKKKSITLEEIVKLLIGTNLRAVLMVDKYEGKKNNKVVQWLPLKAADDDDDDDEEDDDTDDDATTATMLTTTTTTRAMTTTTTTTRMTMMPTTPTMTTTMRTTRTTMTTTPIRATTMTTPTNPSPSRRRSPRRRSRPPRRSPPPRSRRQRSRAGGSSRPR
jgi:hypothetical protein